MNTPLTSNATAAPTNADIRILEKGLIGIGVAMGTAVLVIKASEGNTLGLIAGMALYVVMILAATMRNRRAKAVPRGYGPLLGAGVGGSSGVYAIAVALFSAGMLGWGLAIMMAMLTMTPAMLAAHKLSTLAD